MKALTMYQEVESPSFQSEQYQALYAAMDLLSERQFTAIVMRFWCQMSLEDIARNMSISWDCADSLVTSALHELKSNLTGEEDAPCALRVVKKGND